MVSIPTLAPTGAPAFCFVLLLLYPVIDQCSNRTVVCKDSEHPPTNAASAPQYPNCLEFPPLDRETPRVDSEKIMDHDGGGNATRLGGDDRGPNVTRSGGNDVKNETRLLALERL